MCEQAKTIQNDTCGEIFENKNFFFGFSNENAYVWTLPSRLLPPFKCNRAVTVRRVAIGASINRFPQDSEVGFVNGRANSAYLLDSGLSSVQRFPLFLQAGPIVCFLFQNCSKHSVHCC